MIKSFVSKETAAIFAGFTVRRLPTDIQQTARRKLLQLDFAHTPDELKIPPGNRLEALRGNRKGQWSIRINVSGASVSNGKNATFLMWRL